MENKKAQNARTKRTHLCMHNGVKTIAKKCGRRWTIGGDFDTRGSVSIVAWHVDVENGGGFWAWHTLRGAFLTFEELLSDAELAEHLALDNRKAA